MRAPKLPVRTLKPGALTRAVLTVDRGLVLRRVIPMPVLIALDEPHLIADAHLCYGSRHPDDHDSVLEREQLRGFVARARAYAALSLSVDKRLFLYEHVAALEDIVRDASEVPITDFELARAELFDAVQGGDRGALLGLRHGGLRDARFAFEPHRDHA